MCFNAYCPVILIHASPGKNLGIDYNSAYAGWHAKRRILDVACLLSEDSPKQLFLRRQLGLTLRRYFPDQYVSRFDFSPQPDNAAVVKVF